MATDRVKDYGAFNELPAPTPAATNDPFYLGTGTTKTVTINGQSYTGVDVGSTKPPAAGGVGSISPATGQVITGADRNKAKEAEAIAIGYTKEYIAARGGINAQGYYNDVPLSGQLTAAEQQQVRLPNGNTDTAAMAEILQKKQIAELVANGLSEAEATSKVSAQYGQYGIGGASSSAGGYDANGKPVAGGQYDSSGKLVGTGSSSGMSADSAAALEKRQSAFDLLSAQFAQYGLQALVDPLRGLIQENISPSEFAVRLRQTEPYKKRFAANTTRIAGGLAALSEAEYIGLEDQYQNIMRNYGLPATYYAKGDLGRQEGFEKLIGYDVSAIELEDRISTAQKRVINAPPEVTAALKQFYPSITNADILAYTLDPTKGLDDIKRKITASEIGGAAISQGLTTSLDANSQSLGAEALTKLGITQAEAQRGFSNIAGVLPTAEKLSSIYGGEDYTRLQAEQEQFQQLASAKRARESLTALETAQFGGSAGVGPAGLSTQMLRKSSSAGQF